MARLLIDKFVAFNWTTAVTIVYRPAKTPSCLKREHEKERVHEVGAKLTGAAAVIIILSL